MKRDRLVRRIHDGWRANGSARRLRLTPRHLAELKARINRLHSMGECFAHGTLSDHITQDGVVRERNREEGGLVATEV